MVRNTYIYPPEPSLRIVADIIDFSARHMPRFNPISISGYHMQEAGATSVQELAYTLADGIEYVRAALSVGLDVDDFAPRLSFFFGIGMNFFMEIAKLRAARLLWAELMQEYFQPQKRESLMLRTHCQTSGVSLTSQDPYNNIVRTTIEALAAVLGGTQSLHTNSFDEALALPTDFSARIARNTQLILQEETGVTRVVDPLGGSFYVERLTYDPGQGGSSPHRRGGGARGHDQGRGLGVAQAADRGGGRAAPGPGRPRRRCRGRSEQVPALSRRRRSPFSISTMRPSTRPRWPRLQDVRAGRDAAACEASLECSDRRGGERRREPSGALSGGSAGTGDRGGDLVSRWRRCSPATARPSNRSPVSTGPHTRGTSRSCRSRKRWRLSPSGRAGAPACWSSSWARTDTIVAPTSSPVPSPIIGFDVDIGPLFQTPDEAAQQALENDVHVVGVSSLAAGHRALVPKMVEALRAGGGENIVVVCGGIIPVQDHDMLRSAGVSAFFGPGTNIPAAAREILGLITNDRTGG